MGWACKAESNKLESKVYGNLVITFAYAARPNKHIAGKNGQKVCVP